MFSKSIFVSIIFIFNALIQLMSQIAITRIFGAKLDLDIFLAAVAIPTLIVSTVYATLNDAFLPIYGQKKVKDPKNATTYLFQTLTNLVSLSFLIALIMNFLSLPISKALYASRGGEFVSAVAVQMNYMFYSMPLAIVATILGVHYYSKKKFYRFPFAQLVGNATNLLMIILLQPLIGIWSMVFAFVANLFFQITILFPLKKLSLPNNYSLISNNFYLLTPNLSSLLKLLFSWFPLILAYSAFRSETVFVRAFASSLPTGYMVYLNLILKMFTLTTGVATIGLQVLLLPHLVEYFADVRHHPKAILLVNQSKLIALIVSTIIAFITMLTAPILINLLFVGGKFSAQDAKITISMLPLFVIPAIAWGSYGVFFQPILALKKSFHLAIICTLSLGLGWLVGSVIKSLAGPLAGISVGLIVWLGFGIIGAEFLWQIYKKKNLNYQAPPLSSPHINEPILP